MRTLAPNHRAICVARNHRIFLSAMQLNNIMHIYPDEWQCYSARDYMDNTLTASRMRPLAPNHRAILVARNHHIFQSALQLNNIMYIYVYPDELQCYSICGHTDKAIERLPYITP